MQKKFENRLRAIMSKNQLEHLGLQKRPYYFDMTQKLISKLILNSCEDKQNDDEDAFYTPGTTPPNEELHQEIFSTKLNTDELQERLLLSKLYHKYTIKLMDLQVLLKVI